METAAAAARAGHVVTFGIKPTSPDTGYGYIEVGTPLADIDGAHELARFIEKPDLDTAARLLTNGRHLWNSGMFVFTAATMLREMECHVPSVLNAVRQAVAHRRTDLDFIRLEPDAFTASPNISLDHAVA